MTQKSTNRSEAIKKLRRYINFAKPSLSRKSKSIFHLINKEEDEDNEQTLWFFSGRQALSKLKFG
jgi:hypothetical protein